MDPDSVPEVDEGVDEDCPTVPEGLIEIAVAIDEANMTPQQFKEVFGNEAGNAS